MTIAGKELEAEFKAMVARKTIGCTNIKVDGFFGKWSVIHDFMYKDQIYFMLEHETYGDETASIIIDENGKLFLDEVYQLSDFYEFVDDIEHYLKYIENYN